MIERVPYMDTVQGVTEWESDTDAVVAALSKALQGRDLFPQGTSAMYVHTEDQAGYDRRRAQLSRIVAGLVAGTLRLTANEEGR